MDDGELLHSFSASGDEEAFRALADRHIALVYNAARRRVGDAHLAEDVTQAVFVMLVKKMRGLPARGSLAGWLFAATRYIARDMLKKEARRRRRETAAAQEQQIMNSQSTSVPEGISPMLDDGLSRLAEPERSAVALRYLEGKSVSDVAAAMGISTEAAQKRISRGLAHLRESFSRRGIMLSIEAIGAALAGHAQHPVPARLAASTVAAAVLAKSSLGIIALMSTKAKLFAIAASIAVLFVAATLITAQLNAQRAGPAASTQPAKTRIKAGIIMSQFTATGPCWTGNRPHFGYLRVRESLGIFSDPEVELFAILEPDTQRSGEIAPLLRRVGQDHIVDGADPAALQKLDVIVSYFQWNIEPKVLEAIDQAVHNGTGFYFQTSAGSYHPGYVKSVQDLQCIQHAKRFYIYLREIPVRIIGDHPLLAGLKDLPDKTITMDALSGSVGKINGTPLMQCDEENMLGDWGEKEAVETGTWDPPTTQPQPTTFYPLYVSQLGKGRVVACQWESAGKQFNELTGRRFYIHCLQWLAGRSLQ